jgi:hypothetical protein
MQELKERWILRIWAQESWKMELCIKRYGSGNFKGQTGFFRSFWGNSGFFEVVGGF